MARAAGILTSRGGLASHAAVVARGWGIPAVVGAAGLEVRDGEVDVGDRVLRAGDVITIDGGTGEVFEGAVAGTTEVVPEAQTLLAWAEELGIRDRRGVETCGRREPGSAAAESPRTRVPPTLPPRDRASRASRSRKASPTPSSRRRKTSSRSSTQLVADGLVATLAGALPPDRRGHESRRRAPRRGAGRVGSRQRRGRPRRVPRARPADEGHRHRLAAPRRRRAGVVNDHTDADYDRAVLDRLAALHQRRGRLARRRIETGCPRLAGYRVRLGRALERPRPATAATWPHPASTATTASGSSSTRT